MAKEKRYVEIEVEVECDEEGMTDEGWANINRLEGLWDVVPDLVTHIGMPYLKSRKEK